MKAMKKMLAGLLVLVMALSLAACGGSADSGSSGDSGSGGGSSGGSGGDTLVVNIWDNNQQAGLQEIADLWTEQSGVPVRIDVVNWDNYWTLLEAGATGGEMPDVFWMHSNNAQLYMENELLLDLTPYIEKDGVDMSKYLQGVTELYSLDGKQYALPKDHDTIGLLYNKAIFDKYGVDYPTDDWTWDDFYTAGKAITDAAKAAGDDCYGSAMNTTNDQDGWFNIVYAYGGYIISDDHKKSGFDDPKTKEAMEFVGKLCSDVFPSQATVSENGTDRLFTSNMVGMITQGTWMIQQFADADNAADTAWAMLPYYDANGNGSCDDGERPTIYNGLGWSASAGTSMPDEAWDLIKWFCSEEMQLKQSELGVTMAAYEGCSDAFGEAFKAKGVDIDAFIRMENEATLVFRPYSKYTNRWSEGQNSYKAVLVDAWNDPSQMDAKLDQLAASMNETLAQE